MVYSDSDFERLYLRYMAEAMPRGESIQAFCSRNKVPYNLYDKWYTDTRHKVVPVNVTGRPEDQSESTGKADIGVPAKTDLRIMVDIRMTNGLRIQQRNLSYRQLVRLVGSLEGLC